MMNDDLLLNTSGGPIGERAMMDWSGWLRNTSALVGHIKADGHSATRYGTFGHHSSKHAGGWTTPDGSVVKRFKALARRRAGKKQR